MVFRGLCDKHSNVNIVDKKKVKKKKPNGKQVDPLKMRPTTNQQASSTDTVVISICASKCDPILHNDVVTRIPKKKNLLMVIQHLV